MAAANPSLARHPMVDDWLSISSDGHIQVRSGKVDIGQRISTAIAIVAAEELGVSPHEISIEPRQTGPTPNEGITSGSNSIEQSANAVRLAAATARRHLIDLAADHLNIAADKLALDDGLVREPNTNHSVPIADLIGGRAFSIPVDAGVPLTPPDAYRQVGKFTDTRGVLERASGTTRFIHDMRVDGMLHARMVHPPHVHAQLRQLDKSVRDRIVAAGLDVILDGSFVAVAGADEFAVIRAAERLAGTADWDLRTGLPEGDVFTSLTVNDRVSLPVIDGIAVDEPVATIPAAPPDAAATLSVRYERPYQLHGSIGPSAAMALCDSTGVSIWTHSQGIYPLRDTIAQALGRASDEVTLHHGLGPGCYGHNGADDVAYEAVLIARALPNQPILLKWTRQDEHCWEPFAPPAVVEVRASLDPQGRVCQWIGQCFSDTHMGRPGADPARLLASRFVGDGVVPDPPKPSLVFHGGIHRNLDPYYTFQERLLVKHLVRDLPHRTSAMRCLGAVANIFAMECFMDELAAAAGQDPVTFRLAHLADPRARAVLETAADGLGDLAASLPDGHGRGIAFGRYKNAQTYACVAVEVRVDDGALVHLLRAVIAADAGEVIDVDGLKAQLEGGFMQAASWALCEEVRHDRDGILSRDWDSYPILGFSNVPDVEVILIDRPGHKSMGAGEASCSPAVAAIGNAVCAATGLRLRRLPFTPDALRCAAMNQ